MSEKAELESPRVYDEQQRRAIVKCYRLLLALVDNESAGPEGPAGEQASEPAGAKPPLRRELPDE